MRVFRRLIAIGALAAACTVDQPKEQPPAPQVLFVCERGNVKSLMAASYFNRLATERGLPFRAASRGAAPDSTSIPAPVLAGLRSDGLAVDNFRPIAVSTSDVAQATRVVLIATDLPIAHTAAAKLERWDDVPPASANYAGARDALKDHIEDLLRRLSGQPAR
jgi:arsenate reductase (thioredoxin)